MNSEQNAQPIVRSERGNRGTYLALRVYSSPHPLFYLLNLHLLFLSPDMCLVFAGQCSQHSKLPADSARPESS